MHATPAQIWNAWTDPAILPRWFGPKEFHRVTKEISLVKGGVWRFDMIGHGMTFPNRHRFTEHVPMERICFLMDADTDAEAPYEVVVALTPEPSGTRLTQTITLPTAAKKAEAVAFGAEAMGHTTLDKLAAILAG